MSFGNYAVGFYRDAKPALQWNEMVLKFEAESAGTEWSKKPGWSAADDRIYAITGNGSADLAAARAEELVRLAPGKDLDSERQALKTGLQTYFTNIPAAADGAKAYAFALALGQCNDVASVEIERVVAATGAVFKSQNTVQSEVIAKAAINSSNQLVKDDGSTAIVYGTDTLVVMPAYGIAFGAVVLAEADNVIASGETVTLRVLFK